MDRRTWQALMTGYVELPRRRIHAGLWFRLHRIDQGRIMGVRTGEGIQLRFSADIPERARQAFRNVWTPPPGGGSGCGHRATG